MFRFCFVSLPRYGVGIEAENGHDVPTEADAVHVGLDVTFGHEVEDVDVRQSLQGWGKGHGFQPLDDLRIGRVPAVPLSLPETSDRL